MYFNYSFLTFSICFCFFHQMPHFRISTIRSVSHNMFFAFKYGHVCNICIIYIMYYYIYISMHLYITCFISYMVIW